jgi:hypothetical protein
MTRGWIVLAGWGAILVAFAAVQVIFEPEAIELALLGGSGAIVIAGGAVALASERSRRGPQPIDRDSQEVLRWTSGASAGLAVGLCLLVLGWEVGPWMIGIGAGLVALGIAGLVREHRAARG